MELLGETVIGKMDETCGSLFMGNQGIFLFILDWIDCNGQVYCSFTCFKYLPFLSFLSNDDN